MHLKVIPPNFIEKLPRTLLHLFTMWCIMINQIKTSDSNWRTQLMQAVNQQQSIMLIDDAQLGFYDKSDLSAYIASQPTEKKITPAALLSMASNVGLTGIGVWLVRLAIVDPEPTSKLSLLVAGGITCILTGSLSFQRHLTAQSPPSIEMTLEGIRIYWDK